MAGLVLAAGGSTRLGEPKQLLPFGDATLLDATMNLARACAFDQLLVTIGGAAPEVRSRVDLSTATVVDNAQYTSGCSSSIVAALKQIDERAAGFVLLLGDQPGVQPESVRALIESMGSNPLGVCRYEDGPGHPFWFAREVFDDLAQLHGDKGVWKLLESGRYTVSEVPVSGAIPIDVDTRDDYEALLASAGAEASR